MPSRSPVDQPQAPPAEPPSPKGAPDQRQVLSQFNTAFSLMSIIPLLICSYLITARFFTIEVLVGINGVYLLLAVVIAFLGLLAGRIAIQGVIRRLVETNAALAKLNEQQMSFVSNVSHEFRAPLTVIKSAMDNLADGLHGPLTQDQNEPIEMCQREATRLKRLVGDLLDIARIEAGKMRLVETDVVLQELLTASSQLFTDRLKKRGLGFSLELPDTPAIVRGDRDRLQQVFMNLLSNAAKFTERGEIRMRLTRDSQAFQVEIEDTGPGVAPEDRERIFDKFERVGTQTEEGSGLGLPIARDLVGLHHGRLWVEGELGKGSRFIVRLPAGRPAS